MKPLAVLVLGVMCVACLGCGAGSVDLGEVSGRVTLDGAPVPNAMVSFTPTAGGRGSVGLTDAAGNYTMAYGEKPGALVGVHKVAVRAGAQATGPTFDPNMSSDSPEYEAQAMGGSADDYNNAQASEMIPAKYNSQTTLEFEVKPGSNTFNIEMTSG